MTSPRRAWHFALPLFPTTIPRRSYSRRSFLKLGAAVAALA
ncbi:MAG: twin-arginine translocation signal domain-containing protein, partial [Opitutaceae bacterium]